jgi:glycerol-3-phosphate acyltransferase PlsY
VDIVAYLVTVLAAYLLGSIPTGYLAGRWKGIDIRAAGSGNIGATNAFRILGKTAGTVVLLVDGLKGWLAVTIAPVIYYLFVPQTQSPLPEVEHLRIIAGVVVIIGHNYTCWLNFKGGKGIATSAGVLAALVPWAFIITLGTWIVVCLVTRYVSLASIAASAILPFATWAMHYSLLLIGITALMGALAIYKHKANIARLINGTENKIGGKKPPPDTGVVP